MISLAREKVFFYAFESNNVNSALFATSSILPQMAPKFARVLVAFAVADANVDTRSWLIKQTSGAQRLLPSSRNWQDKFHVFYIRNGC